MKVLLAQPRGFCAGVERAIDAVVEAIRFHGAPVYVLKQIVHNNTVVRRLRERGAVFIQGLDEAPAGATVVFSAHGVGPAIQAEGASRALNVIDATCPLVTKVHVEARRYLRQGRPILIIGHADHDEVIGTLGHARGQAAIVGTCVEAETVPLPPESAPAALMQTTFSLDDARAILEVLRRRFPKLVTPAHDDICYATQNRQAAVREIARRAEAVVVLGADNSSNSKRLREIAEATGARAFLIEDVSQFQPEWFEGARSVGVTSGASTPEVVVAELIDFLRLRFDAEIETLEVMRENVFFPPPSALARSQARLKAGPAPELGQKLEAEGRRDVC